MALVAGLGEASVVLVRLGDKAQLLCVSYGAASDVVGWREVGIGFWRSQGAASDCL